MADPRDRLTRLLSRQDARDRPVVVGAAVTAAWLLLVAAFWIAGGTTGGPRLWSVVGAVLPLALIWLAVGLARAIATLRAEALELRAELARMQARAEGTAGADLPPQPTMIAPTRPAAAPVAAPTPARPAAPARASDPRQNTLHLDPPPAPRVAPEDLVRALNFPDGPDDTRAIQALRAALADPETKRLIRAAQDVVTLLAQQGVYMDDLPAVAAPGPAGALWRRYATGARGEAVAGLRAASDPAVAEALAAVLRRDDIFRDAVQHFLRQFDRALTRLAAELDDEGLGALADSRSGRAFACLGQASGLFG